MEQKIKKMEEKIKNKNSNPQPRISSVQWLYMAGDYLVGHHQCRAFALLQKAVLYDDHLKGLRIIPSVDMDSKMVQRFINCRDNS